MGNVMKKIADINISTPDKGVEIAKSLFSPHKTTEITTAKTLYLSQQGKIYYEKKEELGSIDVITTINTKKKKNYVSKQIAQQLKQSQKVTLTLTNNIIITEPHLHRSETLKRKHVELGTETLKYFYIKPIHKSKCDISFLKPRSIFEDELDQLQILDQKIHDITKQFSLSTILKPTNYLDEFDKFICKKANYNPQFTYDLPSNESIIMWQDAIKRLGDIHQGGTLLKSPIATLLYEKIDEVRDKIELIKAYKEQKFSKINKYNQQIYGQIQSNLLKEAEDVVNHHKPFKKKHMGKKINASTFISILSRHMKELNIKGCSIILDPINSARVSIIKAKKLVISVSPRAFFRENEIQ